MNGRGEKRGTVVDEFRIRKRLRVDEGADVILAGPISTGPLEVTGDVNVVGDLELLGDIGSPAQPINNIYVTTIIQPEPLLVNKTTFPSNKADLDGDADTIFIVVDTTIEAMTVTLPLTSDGAIGRTVIVAYICDGLSPQNSCTIETQGSEAFQIPGGNAVKKAVVTTHNGSLMTMKAIDGFWMFQTTQPVPTVHGQISTDPANSDILSTIVGVPVQVEVFNVLGPLYRTIPSPFNSHIECKFKGLYQVNGHFSILDLDTGSRDVLIGAYINNGTDLIESTAASATTTKKDDNPSISFSAIISLDAGDTIEVWMTNLDDSSNFTVSRATLSIIGLDVPEVEYC